MEAAHYQILNDKEVQCLLCPHKCKITNGSVGICKVRRNIDGKLHASTYKRISSLGIDPIEKKPLYHFHPGSRILSIGSIGCNMSCGFCQNAQISQCDPEQLKYLKDFSSEELISQAKSFKENIGIAFTYNEPIINFEFVLHLAKAAKSHHLKTALISNGYVNSQPLTDLLTCVDAFNIDLKAFDNRFYRNYTGSLLQPVKAAIKQIAKSSAHLEITNLVIPGLNDNKDTFERMVKWIRDEAGNDVPLHISRYFPKYKLNVRPTSEKTLYTLFELAQKYLTYVYLGNLSSDVGQNTYCPMCGNLTIRRKAYVVDFPGLTMDGLCKNCESSIINRNT